MRIALGGDSAGAPLILVIAQHLRHTGHEVSDLSKAETGGDDLYADIAERVAHRILAGEFERGILCCGTGIGVAISANKIPGIRAAQAHDTYSAQRAALSNNAQIITMGARVIGPELAKSIVDAWLAERFDPEGRSAPNVRGIDALDEKYARS